MTETLYRHEKKPAVEYDLVQFWADDLKLSSYFELIEESETKRQTADTVLDDIEKDPYGLDLDDPAAERKMKQFLEAHSDKDVNQAVAMYMVGALQYFNDMPKPEVKKIAQEIAMMGMTGIDPKKTGIIFHLSKAAFFRISDTGLLLRKLGNCHTGDVISTANAI